MANTKPFDKTEIKTKFLLNPFIWFAVVWTFVLILHSFNFSAAYPATSEAMMAFIIILIAVSIFLAFAFDSFFLKKLKNISISSKPIWGIIIFSLIVLAVECVYSKQVPILSVLTKKTTYKDFGIPILSGFMYSFSIFISLVCSLKVVYGVGNKRANIIALLFSYLRFILVYSRGGLVVCLLLTIIIAFTRHKFTWKSVLVLLALAIIGLYLFNILGNIRMGYSSNDSSYLLKISQFKKEYYWLSDFSWGIIYMDSPFGNLLYNEANIAPLNSLEGLFSQLTTSVIVDKLYPSFNSSLTLAIPNLTVSTMFAGGYKYYGYFGMSCVYIGMAVVIFLSSFLCKKRSFALVGCASFLSLLCAMSFFDNMFYESGSSFALIYLVIYIYLFYKEKKKVSTVNVNKPTEVVVPAKVEEPVNNEPKPKKEASLAWGTIFYLIYNVFNAIFPFITALYVTRILSSTVIGDVSYALNIVSYFALFAFVGIPTYGMREIAKYRDDQDKLNHIFSELLIINTITTTISVAAFIALIFIVPDFNGQNLNMYLIVGIEIALNYFNITWLYEGLEKFGFISLVNIVTKVVSLIFLIMFVKGEEHSLIYALISVIGIAGNYFLSFFFFPKYVRFTTKNLHFKQHIKPILLLVVVNLAIEIYSLLDITMIGAIMPDKAHVAYYKYAHQIQKTMLMVINTITLVLVPRLSKFYKDGKIDEYNALINKTLTIIIMLAAPMVIGVMFVSDTLVVWLYGSEYIASSIILKILTPIVLFSPIGYLLGSRVCLVTDHEKYMPIAVGAGAIVNVGLNALFIYLWGEAGAAIASFASEIVVLIVYLIFSHKYFKIKINLRDYAKIGVSLVVMTGYLLLLHFLVSNDVIRTIAEILGAIAIYFILLIILKEDVMKQGMKKVFKR